MSFYAEIWSDHANFLAACSIKEDLDRLVKELKNLGWNESTGQIQDITPEPWFVVDYFAEEETDTQG